MSKKIKIPSINIKNNLVNLFHDFMKNSHDLSKRKCRNMYGYPCYGYMDDDDDEMLYLMSQGYVFPYTDEDYYDDDDGDVIWPPKKGKSKHRKHRKGSKARMIDLNQPYSGDEDNPREVDDEDDNVIFTEYEEVDDNGLTNGKEIYYYPDYHDKNSRLEFSTLNAFNEFCMDNGFSVPEHVANEIMYRRISHTCLRPDAKVYGLYEIVAEESYGVMVYEVCEPSELGNL